METPRPANFRLLSRSGEGGKKRGGWPDNSCEPLGSSPLPQVPPERKKGGKKKRGPTRETSTRQAAPHRNYLFSSSFLPPPRRERGGEERGRDSRSLDRFVDKTNGAAFPFISVLPCSPKEREKGGKKGKKNGGKVPDPERVGKSFLPRLVRDGRHGLFFLHLTCLTSCGPKKKGKKEKRKKDGPCASKFCSGWRSSSFSSPPA